MESSPFFVNRKNTGCIPLVSCNAFVAIFRDFMHHEVMEISVRNNDCGPRYAVRRPVNGIYRFFDKETGKTKTLGTRSKQEAQEMVTAMNDKNKGVNHIRKMIAIYQELLGELLVTESWQDLMNLYLARTELKESTLEGRRRGFKSREFDCIRDKRLSDCTQRDLEPILQCGKTSIIKYLRDLHSFALERGLLAAPLVAPKRFKIKRKKVQRAITEIEHHKIISTEKHEDFRLYLELMWETGISNTDLANLRAEDCDGGRNILAFERLKTGTTSRLGISAKVQAILSQLPKSGLLFPRLHAMGQRQRSSYFHRRVRTKETGLSGSFPCLHQYRHSFVKRAFEAGVPLIQIMAAMGHKSSVVTLYYGKTAEIVYQPIEDESNRQKCA